MKPVFFQSSAEFKKWLSKNYKKETELIVGYYKVNTGKPSMTWSESVDQAICFGWIDGVRRSIDEESYCIRFTPRRPTSIWSETNIKKVARLTESGLMKEEGLAAFALRKDHKSGIYSYENELKKLTPEMEKVFKKNKMAWKFFTAQPPSYKKVLIHWITSAKQEKTRTARLEKAIKASEEHIRLF